MVVRCHALPTAVPILKKLAFDLMTVPALLTKCRPKQRILLNDSCHLCDLRWKRSSLVPGIRASGRAGRDRGVLVDGRDKAGHDVSGTLAFILFSSGTRH